MKKLSELEKGLLIADANLSQWNSALEDIYNKDPEEFSEISLKIMEAVKSGWYSCFSEEEMTLVMKLAFFGVGIFLKKFIGREDPDMAYPGYDNSSKNDQEDETKSS